MKELRAQREAEKQVQELYPSEVVKQRRRDMAEDDEMVKKIYQA